MTYRIGRKNPLNIYEVTPGDAEDRSVTQCHTPEDAARIVAAVNAADATQLRNCITCKGTGRAPDPDCPRAQKQGWGMSTFTGDPPPIPTYGPGSRFAEVPRHTGEPPSDDTTDDTPETIARRALVMIPEPGTTELLTDEIAKRIRALAVGERVDELRLVARWIGSSSPFFSAVQDRIRALESGGEK